MAAVKLRNAEVQASGSPTKVRLSTSGGGCFDFSASRTVGVDLLTGVEVNASSARRKLPRRTKPSARDIFPRVSVSASVDSAAAVDIVGGAVSALMLLGDYVRALLEEAGADEAV
ncbi:hypothetical protein CLOM_g577 [Closterium sp. NIES-68]|nr:hypothetical protein CLOM_g577 [Closterium sp. NIES-68]